jgi:hypothetical protein
LDAQVHGFVFLPRHRSLACRLGTQTDQSQGTVTYVPG